MLFSVYLHCELNETWKLDLTYMMKTYNLNKIEKLLWLNKYSRANFTYEINVMTNKKENYYKCIIDYNKNIKMPYQYKNYSRYLKYETMDIFWNL